MKLVTVRRGRSEGVAIKTGSTLVDAADAAAELGLADNSLLSWIRAGDRGLERLRMLDANPVRHLPDDCELLAPIPLPHRNVMCVGRNYLAHVREFDHVSDVSGDAPDWPHYFTKAPQCVIGPDREIPLFGDVTQALDYEVELAIIISKDGRDIPTDAAMDHIFGYTICNDISARDLQRRHGQWFKGKSLDGSCPLGPWIVTADAIPDPHALAIELRVNDQIRQKANTAQMIFDIPTIVSQLSAGMTLMAGDVISTGTPEGVGYAMDPPGLLRDKDVVECRIEGIGTLRNEVRQQTRF